MIVQTRCKPLPGPAWDSRPCAGSAGRDDRIKAQPREVIHAAILRSLDPAQTSDHDNIAEQSVRKGCACFVAVQAYANSSHAHGAVQRNAGLALHQLPLDTAAL